MLQSHLAEQIAANCVSALVGGAMFYLWWRLDSYDRQRVWRLYGWFSSLMMCGSCVGVLTWLAKTLSLVQNLNASDILQDSVLSNSSNLRVQRKVDLLFAESANWNAVFSVTYSVRMCGRVIADNDTSDDYVKDEV